MKVLIFDSGALINLSMNGLLYVLEDLKKKFNGKFIITEPVKYETVDRPLGIERFELGAIEVKNLIDSGVLEMPASLNIDQTELRKLTKEFFDQANHLMQIHGNWTQLVAEAEMSCLALSAILNEKGIENMVAIDERTTRTMCENPAHLERLMSEKLHQPVKLVNPDYEGFSKFRFIRSSELIYVAYKKGIIKLNGNKVLEALLYATKFKGSSISFEEINILKKM